MYDAEGFPVANKLERFAIGDRDDALKFKADGSLDIYIQHESPGEENETTQHNPIPNVRYLL